ncbi:MAG: hypothetical protein IPL61_00035 [Myxococcales bacterium]|nr:hypothetical protein [Myxococcales bacterium]
MRRLALAAGAVAACAHPRSSSTPTPTAGLAITIHADRAGGPGRAFVDDRRWLEVPRDGWVELDAIAGDVALDTLVLSAVAAPGSLATAECQPGRVDLGLGGLGAALGQAVAVTLADGAVVTGALIGLGPDEILVRDDALGVVAAEDVRPLADGTDGEDGPDLTDPPPAPGTAVVGRAAGGDRVLGPLVAVRPRALVLAVAEGRMRELPIAAVASVRVDAPGPRLRCRVHSSRPGRQLVRVAYGSPGFGWSAAYQVDLPTGAGAIASLPVVTRFTITAPALPAARPAFVRLVAGLPDGPFPPAEAWRGEVSIGGGPVLITGPAVDRDARLELVYRGALGGDEAPTSEYWHAASHGLVWQELALAPAPSDLAGPLEVVLDDDRSRRVRARLGPPALDPPAAVRVPLATSATLIGYRHKRELVRDGRHIVDEILYSVTNHGAAPATVTIEEELRFPDAVVRYERPEPGGERRADRWRRTVEVPPDGVAQGALVLQYRTQP